MALTKDMRREIRIWLVTTDHLEDGLWFRDESDFKVGMNYVAALAADTGVIVLAFILMSNHVHFIIDNALTNGYTVAWDGDLTSGEFNHNRGIAICPNPEDFAEAVKLEKVYPDRVVTQEMRQKDFETFRTVDDHLMHLTGLFKDQNGNYFYKTKNSWGEGRNPEMKGYLYMSRAYIMMRGIGIMVHKDAIPKDIRKKMGL